MVERAIAVANVSTPSPPAAARPALRVAWVGEHPRWLEHDEAKAELETVELESVPAHIIQGRRGIARLLGEPEIVHLSRSALGKLPALRRALPESVLALDLTGEGESKLGRSAGRSAGAADLVLAGSLCELQALQTQHPALASRSAVLQRPLDLGTHVPEASLLESRRAALKRFRSLHRFAGPTVLFAGPFTEAGGLDLALEAVHLLRERNAEIRLAAIPRGKSRQRYLDRCERRALGLGHHGVVEWAPRPEELPFWYAVATVVCLPCREEVGGETAKLAAAAARPFAGSEVRSLAENVVDGETGLLLPAGDLDALAAALERLITNGGEARRLGGNGRRRAEQEWSPATAAAQLRRLWNEALAGQRGRVTAGLSRVRASA